MERKSLKIVNSLDEANQLVELKKNANSGNNEKRVKIFSWGNF